MKLKVAFVCVHNSCRSQMAEGWAKNLGADVMEIYSAGTQRYTKVKPKAVQVMAEAGIDISMQYPKLMNDIPNELDYLIKMGCAVECPYVPAKHIEDWGLEDPSGGSIKDFQNTRDKIQQKVKALIARIEKST